MSTFSSEMKQMFKKWLYKPADFPPECGGRRVGVGVSSLKGT